MTRRRQTARDHATDRSPAEQTTDAPAPQEGRALDRERAAGALDEVHDPGRQPGAHGRQSPHREIKPGVQRALEEASRERR